MTILSNYNGDIDCWRKMQFNSVKRGNFSRMAGHVNKVMDQALQAGRETAVDNTAIAAESIKGRSLERRAAMKAEGKVAQAGLQAFAKTKDTKNKIESKEKINDILRPAKRMAGVVAGLGAISQAAVMQKNLKDDRADRAALKADQQAVFDAQQSLLADTRAQTAAIMEQIKNGMNATSSAPSGGTSSKPEGAANNATSSTVPSNTSSSNTDGSTGMRYMKKLVDNGMSPTQAAATVGHLEVESAGFTAHEEFQPNAYGTRGAGVLQWTNIPGGSQRRTEFENWSSRQGLKPTSFEANSGYLLHEMSTGNHWTGGGSLQGFKNIDNLTQASQYLENNYIRPSAGSSGRRQSAAQKYLNQWNSLNG